MRTSAIAAVSCAAWKIKQFRGLDAEPQPLFPIALGIEREKRESLRLTSTPAGLPRWGPRTARLMHLGVVGMATELFS
jgi:hypothetical protein